jgi:hypothetical protein
VAHFLVAAIVPLFYAHHYGLSNSQGGRHNGSRPIQIIRHHPQALAWFPETQEPDHFVGAFRQLRS